MPNQLFQDTLERLAELGKTTGTQTKQASTGISKQIVREATAGRVFAEKKRAEESMPPVNHTPLDRTRMQYLDDVHRIGEEDARELARHRRSIAQYIQEQRGIISQNRQIEKERQQELSKESEDSTQPTFQPLEVPRGKPGRGMVAGKKVERSRSERKGGSGKF